MTTSTRRHRDDSSLELYGTRAQLYPKERSRLQYPIQCVPARSKSVPPAVDEREMEDEPEEVAPVEKRIELPIPRLIVARQSDSQQLLNDRLLSLYFESLKLEQLLLLQKNNEHVWNEHRLPKGHWYELRDEQFHHECHLNNEHIDDSEVPPQLIDVLHQRKQIKRLLDAYSLSLD
uniref:Uncharacterized protein n=1 Tax=Plectus sambesii TaxID=2011161 RepID=A0A914W2F3_9BILA